MAQVTDRNIGANPTGFDMRTEINNIIAALESDNSGSSEPLNTVAYMKWVDTSNATYYYVKERNHDNTAWVTLFRYTVATKIMEAVSNGVVLQDSNLVHKTGDTMTGNLVMASGTKIQGDFSNSNIRSRTAFQNSTLNENTTLYILPNGNAVASSLQLFGIDSSTSNSSTLVLQANQDEGGVYNSIRSDRTGAGAYLGLLFYTGGAERLRIDTSGNVLVTGSRGLGYGTGSGGTVTQLTSKSTWVTLNKPCGQITMHNASLAAGSTVYFGVTNTLISNGDTVKVNVASGFAQHDTYDIYSTGVSAGGFHIAVKNTTGVALAEALVLSFTIIKGATA